jgi:ribosomal-protein-alanine N-acetyltransferase
MPEIQLLRPDHIPALLDFEVENRAYFAASISDRGDDYFAHFDERLHALLAEQEAGICYFHVIAGRAAGAGLASWAVRELCGIAANSYGLTELRAATTLDNKASRAVLARSGFEVVGDSEFGGRPGLTFHRSLAEFAVRPSAPAVP